MGQAKRRGSFDERKAQAAAKRLEPAVEKVLESPVLNPRRRSMPTPQEVRAMARRLLNKEQ